MKQWGPVVNFTFPSILPFLYLQCTARIFFWMRRQILNKIPFFVKMNITVGSEGGLFYSITKTRQLCVLAMSIQYYATKTHGNFFSLSLYLSDPVLWFSFSRFCRFYPSFKSISSNSRNLIRISTSKVLSMKLHWVYLSSKIPFDFMDSDIFKSCIWCLYLCWPMIRIRIRIRIHQIHMFLGIPDPSIIKQNRKKKPWFLLFRDFFWTFYLWKWCKCTFKK